MGQAKLRGTREERIRQAEKELKDALIGFTENDISNLKKISKISKKPIIECAKAMRQIRNENDEKAKALGYERLGNTKEGMAIFINANRTSKITI